MLIAIIKGSIVLFGGIVTSEICIVNDSISTNYATFMKGCVYLCRVMYAYVWLCRVMYGYVGLCMAM